VLVSNRSGCLHRIVKVTSTLSVRWVARGAVACGCGIGAGLTRCVLGQDLLNSLNLTS
jgi:hypothetical protein